MQLEKEDALLLTHSLNDWGPAVLICVAGEKEKERWNAFALDEGWDFEVKGNDAADADLGRVLEKAMEGMIIF